jgi:hypothetical protein
MIFLAYFDFILALMDNWKAGICIQLPGDPDSSPSLLVPRVGVVIGDLLELRLLAGTNASWAVRCQTELSGTWILC